jgi:hypothetical protein
VPPSSLIFLVVIAIWAAYFLQHWVRRREQLAIARSVDRFSESMRVLERRSALAAPDLSEPQPTSYAVGPARPARPQVLVKRADSAAAGATSSVTGDDAGPWADAQPVASTAPALRGPAPLATGRRARGLTFLGVVAALLATTVLAVLGVVPVPAVAAPVAALGAVLVWMRRGAQAEQAARREASRRQRVQRAGERAETARRTSGPGQTGRVARAERSTQDALAPGGGVPTDAAATAGDGSADAEAEADAYAYASPERDSRREDLYDIQAVEAGEIGQVAAAAAPAPTSPTPAPVPPTGLLVDEDDIPLTWDPVPVPRPTYTMKAMAQRHAPAPVEQGVPPELADAAYDEPVRRVAGA